MLVAAGASAATILAGCGSSSSDGADDGDPTVTVTVATTAPQSTTALPQPTTAPSGVTTAIGTTANSGVSSRTRDAVRALGTAAMAVPNGRPYDLEGDDHRGERAWEIKVASGNDRPHELMVSADGRRILEHDRKDGDDDAAKVLSAEVTLAEALQIADRRVSGNLDEAEIDRERGTVIWTVKFDEAAQDREHEVIVDAATGEVIAVETDED